jgi:hypothetical protein
MHDLCHTALASRVCLLMAAGWWGFAPPASQAQAPATEVRPAAATAGSEEKAAASTPSVDPAAAKEAKAKQEPDSTKPGEKWVRLELDAKGKPLALQTAVVKYKSKPINNGAQPLEVDLVGAIHVGDAAYYADLNKRFEAYDALLYELVAPEGTRIQPGQRASSRHALGAMQNGMKSMLELEHQLELIDYTKENFVHADMTPDEFFDAMKERKESFLSMYMRLVGQSIAAQNKNPGSRQASDMDMLSAFFSKDRPRKLKIAMAKQFSDMESLLTSFGGEEGSTLITGRNIKALEVLRRELDGGKQKVGVFYGAGHLADMHERLLKEFGLEPAEVVWLTAWDLTDKEPDKKAGR